MHVSHSLARRLAVLLLILASAGIAVTARAQGTSAQLPDPTDSRTITRLLKRYVKPTVPQWIEIENVHEAYLERFAKLRNEDIARFLEYMRETMNGVPDSRTTKEFLRRLERLRNKIKTEDDRLFNEIAKYLQEEQLAGIERVRRVRERVRLTSGFAAPDTADRSIDIWTLLDRWDNELPPEVLARVDPELANYEGRLIPMLRTWRKAQESMMLALVDELQASGIGELSVENATPEELQAALETFRLAYTNAQAASQKAVDAISQLNERTIKSLKSLAGEEYGRDLRMAYYDLLSKGKVIHDPGNLERITWRLLDIEELDEEVREIVTATRRSYRELDDRQASRLLAVALELQEMERAAEAGGDVEAETAELTRSIQDYATVREDLATRMREELRIQLAELGDPVLIAIIDSGGVRSPREDDAVEERSEDLPPGDPGRGGPTDFIQKAISKRDLETMRANLDPEPWQQAILSTIHDDYLDVWRIEVEPMANACRRAQASIYRVDPQTQQTFMDAEALRRSYALAQDAAARSGAVDARFFHNLSAPISESQQGTLERLRIARLLDLYLRGTDPIFSPMEIAFRRPNIFSHLDELELTSEERARIHMFFDTRSESLLEAARKARDVRFETELRIHELNQRMSQQLASGAIGSTEYGVEYRKLSNEMAERYGEQVQEWKLAEEEFQRDLVSLLDKENAQVFERSWKRESNPTVYRDLNEVGGPIRQALDLDDLTGEQVGAIASILAEYEVGWEELSDEMASVHEEIKDFGALSGPETYDEFHTLEQRFKQLEFEREEVNRRALRRLALYLSPEQRLRIRALRRLEE